MSLTHARGKPAAGSVAHCVWGGILLGLLGVPGPAQSECTGLPRIQTQPRIDAFLVRPEGLLEQFPRGSVGLAAIVAQLVASDYRATLKPTVKLIDRANGLQKMAIGQALSTAVALCQGKDQTMIEMVTTAIAAHHEQEFLNGYYERENARPPAAPADQVGAQQRTGPTPMGNPFKVAPLSDPFSRLK